MRNVGKEKVKSNDRNDFDSSGELDGLSGFDRECA